MTHSLESGRPQAVLVSLHLPGVTDAEHEASLAELARLVDTLGFDVVGHVTQRRAHPAPSAGLGAGKLRDLARYTGGTGVVPSGATKKKQKKDLHKAGFEPVEGVDDEEDEDDKGDECDEHDDHEDAAATSRWSTRGTPAGEHPRASVVVVDNELSPSQIRNLERATGVEVLDRAGVIIEIFWRHARTKEAQMQVEIARLTYEAPRLREKENTGDRQRGGGVGGKGDNQLELDRHRIRDRIAELKAKLQESEGESAVRRQRRKEAMRVALVGYTNAGKSSLMRALSGSEVLVADKLFATLGTTVRAIPGTHPRVLVSDTVGFIKNLPHSLVASFRSTLDEAHEASLLLFVVDASDEAFASQLAVTKDVLREIGADDIPSLLILNKIDRVDEVSRARLRREYPQAIQLSALEPIDVARLQARLEEHFASSLTQSELDIPHDKVGTVLSTVHEHAKVMREQWDNWGARFVVRAWPEVLDKLRQTIGPVDPPPRQADDGVSDERSDEVAQ
ncbi:MAG: GTPase HflX [Deltaproteobacteria bacterium]|nr:GTPase HflX [Deltaproteobacteria bacterium]